MLKGRDKMLPLLKKEVAVTIMISGHTLDKMYIINLITLPINGCKVERKISILNYLLNPNFATVLSVIER